MTRSILFVFSDYPPKTGPGASRNFYLKQHFTELGWQTKVLTMAKIDKDSDTSFADDEDVIRTFSKDATEVLSIAGKYPKIVEIPDRWYLWILPALLRGYKESIEVDFSYIYAGFPSYSSTIVGTVLSKITRKPLILDLRDPFRFRYDPHNMPAHWLYRWLEKKAMRQAKHLLTTTHACADYYQKLYPEFPNKNIHVVHNGYAQEFHQTLDKSISHKKKSPFILLHSGILYQIGRNPEVLLKALHLLIQQGVIKAGQFKLRFRGANTWPALIQQIEALKLTDYIEFKERITYVEAIEEMRNVDANVLIQNSLFNLQIPSKLYDILALKKSVLAITDEQGALAKEMTSLNLPYFAHTIKSAAELLTQLINEVQPNLKDEVLQRRNRYTINKKLSNTLNKALNNDENQ